LNGTFTFKNTGVYGGGYRQESVVYLLHENEKDTRPLTPSSQTPVDSWAEA
jgi:hypothetical protein